MKRLISVFLALLMILSAIVFTPGLRAESNLNEEVTVLLTGIGDEHWSPNRTPVVEGSGFVGNIDVGTWFKWENVNLQAGLSGFAVRYAGMGSNTRYFDVFVGNPGGTFADAIQVGTASDNANTSGWGPPNDVWTDAAQANPVVGGVRDIYLRLRSGTGGMDANFGGLRLYTEEGTWTDPVVRLSGAGDSGHGGDPARPWPFSPEPGDFIGNFGRGSWIRWASVDLQAGVTSFYVTYAGGMSSSIRDFEVLVGVPGSTINNAELIGTAQGGLDSTGSWGGPGRPTAVVTVDVEDTFGGVLDVFLRFNSENTNFGSLTISYNTGVWTGPSPGPDDPGPDPGFPVIPPLDYEETEARPATVDQELADSYLRTRHDVPAVNNFGNNNQTFMDTTPIGNGHMGAMIFGGVVTETIVINEKTVWSGGQGQNPNYPNHNYRRTPIETHASLQSIRERLQAAVTDYSENGIIFDGDNVISDYPEGLHTQGWNGGHNPNRNQIVRDIEAYLTGGRDAFGSYQELGRILLLDPEAPRPPVPPPPAINVTTNAPGNPAEAVPNIFLDNDAKWFNSMTPTATSPTWIEWSFGEPYAFSAFTVATANDMPARDPSAWRLLGRNNEADEWSVIHQTTAANLPTGRNTSVSFSIGREVEYEFFRFEITAVRGPGTPGTQISRLLLGRGTPPTAPNENTASENYDRGLYLETGIVRTTYTRNGIDYTKEYFMNFPDNVFAMRMSGSDAFDQAIGITTPQPNITVTVEEGNILQMVGQPAGHIDSLDAALHFMKQIRVIAINEDGEVDDSLISTTGNMLDVSGAHEIILLMVAGTNYIQGGDDGFTYFRHRDEAFTDIQNRLNDAVQLGYNALLRRHLEDYQELFGRVELSLDNAPDVAPTWERTLRNIVRGYDRTQAQAVSNGADRANTPEENRWLEILHFQWGRYLLIASSREGSLPANLQGVWAVGLNPPWEADYHTNINVQMNYWPAEVTNLTETQIPMLEYTRSLVPQGRITAQHYHMRPLNRGGQIGQGSRGWVAYHVNNIWGHTLPESFFEAFYAPEGGSWMALNIWENYQFTRDIDRLREFFPVLFEAALFWDDNLWIDERDGKLVVNPSFSPEHGPYSLGATASQGIVWEVFEATIRAAEVLGYDDRPEIAEIRQSQSQLLMPQIGRAGYFQEWRDESQMDRLGTNTRNPASGPHRHVNHLFPLHPGSMIVPGRSAEEDAFADAMRVTLNTRGDGGTGWSIGWKINFWARLRDGERTHTLIRSQLRTSTLDSMLGTHPPFQIDGNFGGTAGIAEMMLQSHGGAIELLAALPYNTWANGSMTGLMARGNVEVDMFWSDGGLDTAVLHAGTTDTIRVKYSDLASFTVVDQTGTRIPIEVISPDEVRLDVVAGNSYTFTTEDLPCREDLRTVLELAQELTNNNFTAANWRLFIAARNQAQNIYTNANSTQAEIDNAVNTLRNLVNRVI